MIGANPVSTWVDEAELAHRLMGDWSPETKSFDSLVLTHDPSADLSKPYPFYLAYQLDDPPEIPIPADRRSPWNLFGSHRKRGFAWAPL